MESTDKYYNVSLLPEVWRDRPEVIYEFLKRKPYYERLCAEVAFVMETELRKQNIEFSAILNRTKELNSFLEKLERKKYIKPFEEITDLAGVRVVCLYPTDLKVIEDIIFTEFDVVEKVDKRKLAAVDRIGYSALHFLVKLKKEFTGARYDSLKDLICEIQTRTVLQDAWATIDHHLVYKKRSLIPEELRLQINELAYVLDKADNKFEKIRQERLAYIKKLEKTRSRKTFMGQVINFDSFKAFCERAFPGVEKETEDQYYNRVLKWIDYDRYKTLADLDHVVKKASDVLNDVIAELLVLMNKRGIEIGTLTNLAYMQISLAIVDKKFRTASEASPGFVAILEKYDKAIKEKV